MKKNKCTYIINWKNGDMTVKKEYFKCLRAMIDELRGYRHCADILNKYNISFIKDSKYRVNIDWPKDKANG